MWNKRRLLKNSNPEGTAIVYQTTEEHFKMFQRECARWLKKFGLVGWECNYDHNDSEPEARATCEYNTSARLCVLTLSLTWDIPPTEDNIWRMAFHEVEELFLGRLVELAENRYSVTEVDIEEATHSIIRTLETIIFRPTLKRRKRVKEVSND